MCKITLSFIFLTTFVCYSLGSGIKAKYVQVDPEGEENETVEGEVINPTFTYCKGENDNSITELCNNVCGEDSCRSSPYDPTITPISKFCQCGKFPEQSSQGYTCSWSSENAQFQEDCRTTCSNIYTSDGDEFISYICSKQGTDQQESCVCTSGLIDRTVNDKS